MSLVKVVAHLETETKARGMILSRYVKSSSRKAFAFRDILLK